MIAFRTAFDEKAAEPALAFMLAHMRHPEFPEPVGVFRAVSKPPYEQMLMGQVAQAKAKHGPGDLEKLLNSGDTWVVN